MWVLLRFSQKVKWFDSKIAGQKQRVYDNNGLTFTYAEANHYGLSNATFYRAIRTLVRRGFIDVEHRGGTFGHGEIKDYSRFKMSNRWRKWGTDEFEKKSFEVLKFQGEQVQARIKSRFQK
jgi:DNA-binding GntR family transcriptional regulator